MAESLISRFKNAWNVFSNRDPTTSSIYQRSVSYGNYRPDRFRFSGGNERSIVTSIYNKIAMDAATITIEHVRLDKEGRYAETIDSDLNNCLNLEANIDQTGLAFRHDIYASMMDEGCIAVVPTDTDRDPINDSFKVYTARVGRILEWYPDKVKVHLYNERLGKKQDVIVPKSSTLILENPMYAVMNEPNSIMRRLIRKLNILDAIDEQSGSGKLDLIIQLPYVIKTEARRQQAEQRRAEIEAQLSGSKYGIAYADGTERITQLNRSVENNLMKQIEYLTSMLNSQLGITQAILDGTADSKTMSNYYTRTVSHMVEVVVTEMKRKWLTKTARSQRQSITYFRDPFKLVPIEELATIADTFTRNEILSKNEIRQMIGRKPSKDPKADELINSNISQPTEMQNKYNEPEPEESQEGENQNGEI